MTEESTWTAILKSLDCTALSSRPLCNLGDPTNWTESSVLRISAWNLVEPVPNLICLLKFRFERVKDSAEMCFGMKWPPWFWPTDSKCWVRSLDFHGIHWDRVVHSKTCVVITLKRTMAAIAEPLGQLCTVPLTLASLSISSVCKIFQELWLGKTKNLEIFKVNVLTYNKKQELKMNAIDCRWRTA